MCNLNLLIKAKETGRELEIYNFLSTATLLSYQENPDGDGVYFSSGSLIKQKKKINFINYLNEIKQSRYILSHQRITTSGQGAENLQPFQSDDFILLHNGVVSDWIKQVGLSDTHNFFIRLNNLFQNEKPTKESPESRETRILALIKQEFNHLGGSWSVGLYDKQTKVLYYFKNSRTRINAFRSQDKKVLYLTTRSENKTFFQALNEYTKVGIEDFKIYRITAGQDKATLSIVGNLAKAKETTYNWSHHNWNYRGGYNWSYGGNQITKEKKKKQEKQEVQAVLSNSEENAGIREESNAESLEQEALQEAKQELNKKDITALKRRFIVEELTPSSCEECGGYTRQALLYSGRALCSECQNKEIYRYALEDIVYKKQTLHYIY